MLYTKTDMRYMLIDGAGIPEEAIDLVIAILGDSVDTYKKILSKATEFKTFKELEESCFIPDEYM